MLLERACVGQLIGPTSGDLSNDRREVVKRWESGYVVVRKRVVEMRAVERRHVVVRILRWKRKTVEVGAL